LQPDSQALVRDGDGLALVRRPEKTRILDDLFAAPACQEQSAN